MNARGAHMVDASTNTSDLNPQAAVFIPARPPGAWNCETLDTACQKTFSDASIFFPGASLDAL